MGAAGVPLLPKTPEPDFTIVRLGGHNDLDLPKFTYDPAKYIGDWKWVNISPVKTS